MQGLGLRGARSMSFAFGKTWEGMKTDCAGKYSHLSRNPRLWTVRYIRVVSFKILVGEADQ